jgi:hypothetical protein
MKPALDANEWTQIVAALRSKMESLPSQQATYLREISEAIIDGEQASLNEQDWAEIYCAMVDGDADQSIGEKIGPDGKNMVGIECACGALMDDGVCSDPACRFNARK